ncbi:MAG: septum formation initiator family protein [Lachnospiraceae bacterium]|nr:septum formation initiator family protein [Lachnospiraceae bacterium]
MARRAAYQTKYHNKTSIYIVLFTLILFAAVLFVNCNSLNEKRQKLQTEEAQYQELLEKEQQETLDLQELEKSTQTKKYYEQIAKERLGMVYEDEIIFKEKD